MRTVMEPSPILDKVIPEWKDVHALCAVDGPCLTVYLNRYAPGTGTVSQGERLRRAIPELQARGVPATLLEPIAELAAHDDGQGSSDSLALFCSAQGPAVFLMPWAMEDAVAVEKRFVVRPLWESLRRNRRIFVLLLARNDVRVLECFGQQVRQVPLPMGFPWSLQTFGDFDQPDHLLRNRSNAGPSVGAMKAVAFGTGAGHDKDYRRLHDFHCAVQAALLAVLPQPHCPLVLAGTEPDVASFARVNGYQPTVGDVVLGSSDDGTSDAVLASLARQAAMDAMSNEEQRALDRWERSGISRRMTEVMNIVRASSAGLVADLFLTAGSAPEYGEFEGNTAELLNAAMIMTVRHHGQVWMLSPEQMPEKVTMAALRSY